VLSAGCGSGDGAGVDLPSLEILTATTGTELDPDGYAVVVDTSPPRPMGLVDSLIVDPLPDGPHSVTLEDLAANCAVTGGSNVTATVERGKTATVSYAVVCGPTHGRVIVTTTTTGQSQDNDGYQVELDDMGDGPIGTSDTLEIGGVAPGNHLVTLSGVAPNCSVAGDNPRTLNVTAGGADTAAFAVGCVRPVGQVQVEVISSGTPADPDGYTVSLDGAAPGVPIGTTDTVDLSDVPVGSHSVGLGGLAPNCMVQSPNPVQLEVPLGGSVTAAFTVSCLGHSQVIVFTANAPGLLGVFLVSPDGTGLMRLTPNTLLERDARWSPDGRKLLVVRVDQSFQAEALYAMNADGSGRTKLADATSIVDYRWSPDGSRIAFSLGHPVRGSLVSDLWVMQADGSGKVELASNAESPTWSPDGSRIAYVHDIGNLHLRIINSTGGGDHRLTDQSMNTIQPAWSPDGSSIAFVSLDPNQIQVIQADGSGLLNLTQNGDLQEDGPVWSPDGSRIAFNSGPRDQPLESDVIVADPDGRERVNLTHRPGFDLSPDWSPDGGRIVFVRADNGDNEICVMNSDGSDPTDISNRPNSFESDPDWGGQPATAVAGPLSALNTSWNRMLRKGGRTEGR
jgi:Tol biopolymer transport system component